MVEERSTVTYCSFYEIVPIYVANPLVESVVMDANSHKLQNVQVSANVFIVLRYAELLDVGMLGYLGFARDIAVIGSQHFFIHLGLKKEVDCGTTPSDSLLCPQ